MASVSMFVVAQFVRLLRRQNEQAIADGTLLTRPKKSPLPPRNISDRFEVRAQKVHGFDVYSVRSRNRTPIRCVLYLHGGSYVSEISSWHWRFIAKLADAGVEVSVPIYGLAPEFTH